jgi:hypothetical protein
MAPPWPHLGHSGVTIRSRGKSTPPEFSFFEAPVYAPGLPLCGLVWRQEIADMSVALWAEIFSAMDFGMSSESPTWGRTGGDLGMQVSSNQPREALQS